MPKGNNIKNGRIGELLLELHPDLYEKLHEEFQSRKRARDEEASQKVKAKRFGLHVQPPIYDSSTFLSGEKVRVL